MSLNATVSDACDHEGWTLANPRSEQALALHLHLTSLNLPSDEHGLDRYDWVVDNKNNNGFSSSKTWAALRPRAELVSWYSSVWFKGNTPKHAFNMWIANLDRLPTKTRLANWGMQIQTTCGLCSRLPETRDHLLLNCDYALYLWNVVSIRLHLQPFTFGSWPELLSWTIKKNDLSPSLLRKLVAQSITYAIWKQRNNLLHNQNFVPPSETFKEVDREIKNTITARRLSKHFKKLMSLWLH